MLITVLGMGALNNPQPARAGVLGPVLMLLRPQLEQRLASVCIQAAAGEDRERREWLGQREFDCLRIEDVDTL
ncbi:MAG: hypothetical protein NTY67_08985 [Cyanobacteria bacterium]|nr:hypothetical protein [Cyanobacteriota bacterium]